MLSSQVLKQGLFLTSLLISVGTWLDLHSSFTHTHEGKPRKWVLLKPFLVLWDKPLLLTHSSPSQTVLEAKKYRFGISISSISLVLKVDTKQSFSFSETQCLPWLFPWSLTGVVSAQVTSDIPRFSFQESETLRLCMCYHVIVASSRRPAKQNGWCCRGCKIHTLCRLQGAIILDLF